MKLIDAVRYIEIENITWVDFRPCYRCQLPENACQFCRRNQDQIEDSLPKYRALRPGKEMSDS